MKVFENLGDDMRVIGDDDNAAIDVPGFGKIHPMQFWFGLLGEEGESFESLRERMLEKEKNFILIFPGGAADWYGSTNTAEYQETESGGRNLMRAKISMIHIHAKHRRILQSAAGMEVKSLGILP